MIEVLRLLGQCLEPVKPLAHCLLLLDCAPVHCTPAVARAAARAGVLLHYVPASMTGVLQPLDCYAFSTLKRKLRQDLECACLESSTGTTTTVQVLAMTFQVVRDVLQGKSWRHAFLGCGFGGTQRAVGQRVRRRLDWLHSVPHVGSDLPSLTELQRVWYRTRRLPLGWLFHLAACNRACEDPTPAGASRLAGDEERLRVNPWHGRLRSSSHLTESGPAPAFPSPDTRQQWSSAVAGGCWTASSSGRAEAVPLESVATSPKTPANQAQVLMPMQALPISLSRPGAPTHPRPMPVGRPLFRRRSSPNQGASMPGSWS